MRDPEKRPRLVPATQEAKEALEVVRNRVNLGEPSVLENIAKSYAEKANELQRDMLKLGNDPRRKQEMNYELSVAKSLYDLHDKSYVRKAKRRTPVIIVGN
jgi:hypothetical protein